MLKTFRKKMFQKVWWIEKVALSLHLRSLRKTKANILKTVL